MFVYIFCVRGFLCGIVSVYGLSVRYVSSFPCLLVCFFGTLFCTFVFQDFLLYSSCISIQIKTILYPFSTVRCRRLDNRNKERLMKGKSDRNEGSRTFLQCL